MLCNLLGHLVMFTCFHERVAIIVVLLVYVGASVWLCFHTKRAFGGFTLGATFGVLLLRLKVFRLLSVLCTSGMCCQCFGHVGLFVLQATF